MSQEKPNSPGLTLSLGIKTAIAASGTSVHAVASRMGVSSSYLSSLAAGKKNPSQEMLHHLAEAIGIPVSEIYGRGEAELERRREKAHRARLEALRRDHTLEAVIAVLGHLEAEELDQLIAAAQRQRRERAEENEGNDDP